MLVRVHRNDEHWLAIVIEAVRSVGCAVVEGVLDAGFVEETRAALYRVRDRIHAEVGRDKLERAGELGVMRLMLKYEPHFFRLLEVPEVLAVVDPTVSETAVLHLQNGFILPSFPKGQVPAVFQNKFHMDFPRVLPGPLFSINTLFAIDAFSVENGGTLVCPGTHQKSPRPAEEFLKRVATPVECPAGSMLVFDSTCWHAAGANVSGRDRLGINQQFTRSYLKQQMDYCRALGPELIQQQKPRTQQLLGWYTRVPTSLDEYYRPAEERLYRGGQG
ncbi:MAG: phytanoyl-CoA dioxygenase family protein [Phycisphaerae bacterium]